MYSTMLERNREVVPVNSTLSTILPQLLQRSTEINENNAK